jgi:uncharacterized membrane protein YeaQ/YmgE (transglycosylase-associated protein family)
MGPPERQVPDPSFAGARLAARPGMSFLIGLVVGVVVGFVASLMMGTDAQKNRWVDFAVGIVGAIVAGLLVAPAVGLPLQGGAFGFGAAVVSAVGAVLLLIAFNVIRRTRKRR